MVRIRIAKTPFKHRGLQVEVDNWCNIHLLTHDKNMNRYDTLKKILFQKFSIDNFSGDIKTIGNNHDIQKTANINTNYSSLPISTNNSPPQITDNRTVFSTSQTSSNIKPTPDKADFLNSNSPHKLTQKGEDQYSRGDFDKAIKAFTEAIRIDPTYGDAYNNLAVIYFQLGNNSQAIKYFSEGLHFEPNNRSMVLNYGAVLTMTQNHSKALSLYSAFYKSHPGDQEIRNLIQKSQKPFFKQ